MPHLDNLYISSVIAVNPDNGQMKLYYQFTPADEWDYDARFYDNFQTFERSTVASLRGTNES